MAFMELTLPTDRPFTYADLEAMPHDGNRYEIVDGVLVVTSDARLFTYSDLGAIPEGTRGRFEIVDGMLVVSPPPVSAHRRVSAHLWALLDVTRPTGFEALLGPLEMKLTDTTVLVPDVVVGRAEDLRDRNLPTPPLLVVEVLSLSSHLFDRLLKRSVFEDYGIGSYWIVDPDEPSLTVLELVDRAYTEVARVTGDEVFEATRPFPVRVCPAELVSPR